MVPTATSTKTLPSSKGFRGIVIAHEQPGFLNDLWQTLRQLMNCRRRPKPVLPSAAQVRCGSTHSTPPLALMCCCTQIVEKSAPALNNSPSTFISPSSRSGGGISCRPSCECSVTPNHSFNSSRNSLSSWTGISVARFPFILCLKLEHPKGWSPSTRMPA